MHLLVTSTVFAFSAIISALASNIPSSNTCRYSPQVESFAASYYTALVLTHNQGIINSLQLDGSEAALQLFIGLQQNLRLCNADALAYTATNGLARTSGKLTLRQYLYQVGHAFGQAFNRQGVLNCQNSINFGIQMANYTSAEFQQRHLDPKQFMSYFVAVINGAEDFSIAHGGIDLEKFETDTCNEFANEVQPLPTKQCGSSTSGTGPGPKSTH